MIYFAIFDSYLSYLSLVWVQNCNTIQQNLFGKKMTVRIVNIQPIFNHNLSPSVFNNWFSFYSDQHETSSSIQDNFIKLFYKTNRHGSVLLSCGIKFYKICYLKIYSPIKSKLLSVSFILILILIIQKCKLLY